MLFFNHDLEKMRPKAIKELQIEKLRIMSLKWQPILLKKRLMKYFEDKH